METLKTQPSRVQLGKGQKGGEKPNYLIVLVITLVIAVIAAGGYLFYDAQKLAEKQSAEAELKSVAELKSQPDRANGGPKGWGMPERQLRVRTLYRQSTRC